MKPKKRVFCPFCGYSKMLFETEKKANLYLKYNADDVLEENGRKPIRTYYCEACGGWHVTSSKSFRYVEEKYKKDLYKSNISNRFGKYNKKNDIECQKVVDILNKIKETKKT